MNVLLNNQPIDLTPETSLPMLIHGEEKQGASFFTIALASLWFKAGFDILCLSGYEMAKEAFVKIVGEDSPRAKFFTKESVEEFKKEFNSEKVNNRIVLLKNVELFDESVYNLVSAIKNRVVSGNLNALLLTAQISDQDFVTKIYFSKYLNADIPELDKYEGFLVGKGLKGITKLQL